MTDTVDGTAAEIGTDLEHVPATPPTTLFHTDDPVEVVERASRAADALKNVLARQGLTKRISGKDHVLVEGWTTLGSMLGVVPVCVWTRKLDGADGGWEARVEARTLDGRVIGAAEAECLRAEKMWKSRDDYALRSMAQTRATSKALRGPLGFVVTLAGFAATPAEEMPGDAAPRVSGPREGGSDITPVEDTLLSREMYVVIKARFVAAGNPVDDVTAWLDGEGVPAADDLASRIGNLRATQAIRLREHLESLIAKAAA